MEFKKLPDPMKGASQFPVPNSYLMRQDKELSKILNKARMSKSLLPKEKVNPLSPWHPSKVLFSNLSKISLSGKMNVRTVKKRPSKNASGIQSQTCCRTLHYQNAAEILSDEEKENTKPLPSLDLSSECLKLPSRQTLRPNHNKTLLSINESCFQSSSQPSCKENKMKSSTKLNTSRSSLIPIPHFASSLSKTTVKKKTPNKKIPVRKSLQVTTKPNVKRTNLIAPSITIIDATLPSTDQFRSSHSSLKLRTAENQIDAIGKKSIKTCDVSTNTVLSSPLYELPSNNLNNRLDSLIKNKENLIKEIEQVLKIEKELLIKLSKLKQKNQQPTNEAVTLGILFEDKIAEVDSNGNRRRDDDEADYSFEENKIQVKKQVKQGAKSLKTASEKMLRSRSLPANHPVWDEGLPSLTESISFHSMESINSPFANLIGREKSKLPCMTPGTKKQVSFISTSIDQQMKMLFD